MYKSSVMYFIGDSNLDIFPLISCVIFSVSTWLSDTDTENQWSVWPQKQYDVPIKNNNGSLEGVGRHYH